VYLTPAGSQGFAPHYDDIEAFILQLEGKKLWKLYKPRSSEEELPRFSSGNFSPKEVGEPVLEVELQQGDMMYFPRGFIHQARTTNDTHSLHITLSTYQKNTWGDFIEKALPGAIAAAFEEDRAFREGLPRDYLQHVGVVHSDQTSVQRSEFKEKMRLLMTKLIDHMPIDAAADQMAKGFVHDALPPVLTPAVKDRSIHGAGERWEGGHVVDRVELDPDTEIRLISATILRIIMEEDEARIYHSVHNSREYHAEEPQYFVIPDELAVGVESLVNAYPEFTRIEDIALDSQEQKLDIAAQLYDRGLVLTRTRLDIIDDD
jgi:lysine-specific demethylase/histidyl-hydroxylase NO66